MKIPLPLEYSKIWNESSFLNSLLISDFSLLCVAQIKCNQILVKERTDIFSSVFLILRSKFNKNR